MEKSKFEFESWLRSVCFQKPTQEAYDLAKEAWNLSARQLVAKDVEFNKAQDYIHELLTTGHRQNEEIERLKGKTGYCVECERLNVELEQVKSKFNYLGVAHLDMTKERDEWKASNDEWASRYNKQGEDIAECRVELKVLFDRNSLLERTLSTALKENEQNRKAYEDSLQVAFGQNEVTLKENERLREALKQVHHYAELFQEERLLVICRQAIEGREKG